ncbi:MULTISPECIES: class III extradiol ring-cleavage dioxygenase [unclassified Wenzhouxiangella]|uniref:DODA-type extradiol aromatic ring-opening family dioxygenase n=1 Tax=unclassified Wenzhouxiangella TaxID=2613841 RepID=UPI000E32B945|nr:MULTISPECIES: class III extradiol ring-cleavage dioxygenase [unclassified Wenzhouxiangella]RFF27003.1 dioxygenase [Wenzhouxiangella sp. 15181]RFP69515.1 dioxygenase [Wenzhouxiangella sp. 15190]
MHKLPSLFVSHGAPTFALEPGAIGEKLRLLGRRLSPIKAVVVVSPHWITDNIRVTASPSPSTIHDFRGFDPALYEMDYPAPGDPDLAGRIVERLQQAGWSARTDSGRGLDHGAWVPLLHLLPEASVPVVQVSLAAELDGESAWSLGRGLSPLAAEGVLVIGSGSLTHNLYEVFRGAEDTGYAEAFTGWIREVIEAGDTRRLKSALDRAPNARRAHPTPEHYWPLVVAAGAGSAMPTTVLEGGMSYQVLSMDAFVFGELPFNAGYV